VEALEKTPAKTSESREGLDRRVRDWNLAKATGCRAGSPHPAFRLHRVGMRVSIQQKLYDFKMPVLRRA
jgi:hypothetical protein